MILKRSYQTIFDTLGNIGGTNGILMIIILIIFSPIYEYLEGKYLLQIAYPLIAHPPKDLESSRAGEGANKDNLQSTLQVDEVSAVDRPIWQRLLLCRLKKYTKVQLMNKQARKQIKEMLDVNTLMYNHAIVSLLSKSMMTEDHACIS